jgi:hypothetical protein
MFNPLNLVLDLNNYERQPHSKATTHGGKRWMANFLCHRNPWHVTLKPTEPGGITKLG